MKIKTLYLAGPDVFRHDAKEFGEQLKFLCSTFGFEGRFPLDNDLPPEDYVTGHQHATAIFEANMEMLKSCDAVIANLNCFRGNEPDSGTVAEVAAAYMLGKPVFGYTDDLRPMIDQIQHNGDGTDLLGGNIIEDFDLPLNLMICNMLHEGTPNRFFADTLLRIEIYNSSIVNEDEELPKIDKTIVRHQNYRRQWEAVTSRPMTSREVAFAERIEKMVRDNSQKEYTLPSGI